MTDSNPQGSQRIKYIVSLVACIFIGVTFVASGTGKAAGFGEIPGQTIDFIGDIVPKAFINPTTVFLMYDVFIPYVLPAIELLLGIFLLIGFVPRLVAAICIPLTLTLMGNNIWAIRQGLAQFPDCACFGIWEKIFGGLTPVQALYYDIGLFAFAIVIIVLHPGGFLSSRAWLANLFKKKTAVDVKG